MLAIEPRGDDGSDEELGSYKRVQGISRERQEVKVKKGDLPLVLGPALAIERSPGLVCFNLKL